MKPLPCTVKNKQAGATLVIALVMLVLMTLLAVSAINLSTGNLKIVGNMQYQQEASSAAQAAVNQVLSKASYLTQPASVPDEMTINVNGHDYAVRLSQPCLKSVAVLTVADLSGLPLQEAASCSLSSAAHSSGVLSQDAANAYSDCARVTWEIRASVNDPELNAQAEIVEGVSMKMDRLQADIYQNDTAMHCS